jgi:hypothetical protein
MTEQIQQPFSGEEFKQKLIDAGFISSDVTGCSTEEIKQVKMWQKVNFLPKAYIEYLSAIGHNTSYCDPFHACEEWGYTTLENAKEYLANDMEYIDDGTQSLPSDAFVFAQYYQGYYWLYFLTGDNNQNPPVYLASEGKDIEKVADSFTDLLYERFAEVSKSAENWEKQREEIAKVRAENTKRIQKIITQFDPKPKPTVKKSKSLWEQIADFLGLSR